MGLGIFYGWHICIARADKRMYRQPHHTNDGQTNQQRAAHIKLLARCPSTHPGLTPTHTMPPQLRSGAKRKPAQPTDSPPARRKSSRRITLTPKAKSKTPTQPRRKLKHAPVTTPGEPRSPQKPSFEQPLAPFGSETPGLFPVAVRQRLAQWFGVPPEKIEAFDGDDKFYGLLTTLLGERITRSTGSNNAEYKASVERYVTELTNYAAKSDQVEITGELVTKYLDSKGKHSPYANVTKSYHCDDTQCTGGCNCGCRKELAWSTYSTIIRAMASVAPDESPLHNALKSKIVSDWLAATNQRQIVSNRYNLLPALLTEEDFYEIYDAFTQVHREYHAKGKHGMAARVLSARAGFAIDVRCASRTIAIRSTFVEAIAEARDPDTGREFLVFNTNDKTPTAVRAAPHKFFVPLDHTAYCPGRAISEYVEYANDLSATGYPIVGKASTNSQHPCSGRLFPELQKKTSEVAVVTTPGTTNLANPISNKDWNEQLHAALNVASIDEETKRFRLHHTRTMHAIMSISNNEDVQDANKRYGWAPNSKHRSIYAREKQFRAHVAAYNANRPLRNSDHVAMANRLTINPFRT